MTTNETRKAPVESVVRPANLSSIPWRRVFPVRVIVQVCAVDRETLAGRLRAIANRIDDGALAGSGGGAMGSEEWMTQQHTDNLDG